MFFLTNRSESWIFVDSPTILLPRLPLEKTGKPWKNKRETKKVRRKKEKSQPSQSALLTQDVPEQPTRLVERKGACSKIYNHMYIDIEKIYYHNHKYIITYKLTLKEPQPQNTSFIRCENMSTIANLQQLPAACNHAPPEKKAFKITIT